MAVRVILINCAHTLIIYTTQAGHSINEICLISMKLIRSKCDSVRKAREAHLISKAKTLHPFGINRRDEACPLENLNHLQTLRNVCKS